MPVYEASSLSVIAGVMGGSTAGSPIFGFRGSTTQRCRIREMHIFNVTAPTTSGALGLTRSTALGTGTVTGQVGVAREPGDPATTAQVTTQYATAAPTTAYATTTMRRWVSPASLGNGVIWTWDLIDPLIVPLGNVATGELVVVSLVATAPGTYMFSVIWEE